MCVQGEGRPLAGYLRQELQIPDAEYIPKTHLNKHLRRQIAQLNTILRERSLAAGVSARWGHAVHNTRATYCTVLHCTVLRSHGHTYVTTYHTYHTVVTTTVCFAMSEKDHND